MDTKSIANENILAAGHLEVALRGMFFGIKMRPMGIYLASSRDEAKGFGC